MSDEEANISEPKKNKETSCNSISSGFSQSYLVIIFVTALILTAYTSYNIGHQHGSSLVSSTSMSSETGSLASVSYPSIFIKEEHVPLPNAADGPLTNPGALESIVTHHFGAYDYLRNLKITHLIPTIGHGLADDGMSPIPDNEGFEGGKQIYTLQVDFFGKIFKSHYDYAKKDTVFDVLGEMQGLDKQDDIIFVNGDVDQDGHLQFGKLQVLCGLSFKIVDFHMHSGNDARITVHHPGACNDEIKKEDAIEIKGNLKDFKEEEHAQEKLQVSKK